jgi:hypothetical protein
MYLAVGLKHVGTLACTRLGSAKILPLLLSSNAGFPTTVEYRFAAGRSGRSRVYPITATTTGTITAFMDTVLSTAGVPCGVRLKRV